MRQEISNNRDRCLYFPLFLSCTHTRSNWGLPTWWPDVPFWLCCTWSSWLMACCMGHSSHFTTWDKMARHCVKHQGEKSQVNATAGSHTHLGESQFTRLRHTGPDLFPLFEWSQSVGYWHPKNLVQTSINSHPRTASFSFWSWVLGPIGVVLSFHWSFHISFHLPFHSSAISAVLSLYRCTCPWPKRKPNTITYQTSTCHLLGFESHHSQGSQMLQMLLSITVNVYIRGVQLILVQGPHTASLDVKWTGAVQS